MKLIMTLVISLAASVSFAQALKTATYSSTYSTSLIKMADMSCRPDQLRKVKTAEGKVLVTVCAEQYKACMFEGACVLVNKAGEKLGLGYDRYDEAKNQAYFSKINLDTCAYGYGRGRVSSTHSGVACLLPYFSASADPLEYKLGDVVFLPSLVGVKLPTGEVHDGFIVITDYAQGYIDTGADHFSFFTGHDNAKSKKNAFASVGLADPATQFNYRRATAEETKAVQAKRGFKVLKTYKKSFDVPENPMLDEMIQAGQ